MIQAKPIQKAICQGQLLPTNYFHLELTMTSKFVLLCPHKPVIVATYYFDPYRQINIEFCIPPGDLHI